MDILTAISLIVGVVSVVLALVAIWHSVKSERRSTENYDRTKDVLAQISEKAAVIEATVNNTQNKLVDTVTDMARPQRESQEEILLKTLLPEIVKNPQWIEQMMAAAQQQNR